MSKELNVERLLTPGAITIHVLIEAQAAEIEALRKDVQELVQSVIEVGVPRPRENLICHRGLTEMKLCARCNRAARLYAAIDAARQPRRIVGEELDRRDGKGE